MSSADRTRPLSTILLVAGREITTRVRAKAFVWSTLVILAVIVGGQLAIVALSGDDEAATITSVGSTELVEAIELSADAFDTEVIADTAPAEAAARDRVTAGSTDLAVLAEPDGSFTLVSADEPDTTLRALVERAVQDLALSRALDNQGVDADRFTADLGTAQLALDVLDPADPDQDQRVGLAYIAVFLLFFTVYMYGLYVAMGVVEEKTSRVVELLLSAIRPLHLLVGKVLGIGAVGFFQVVLFGGAAVATGLATELITLGGTALALLGLVILWYVLGFTFFAVLYAAFGALVSRQEDVNSATMPLTVLAFAVFIAPQLALADPSVHWAGVLAWVPPFSSTLVPLRVAAGEAGGAEVVGSVVLMVLATAVSTVVAARIYRRSVLETGARRSLRSALR